ncbi:type 2 lanthipeptide synthetase LanM family protein [Bacillus halotolerans]|uniref:type 2 lanthipeptide synthetase LanM family protein n=1 Tax=Bacillus halotolerans TaxID=260554 RepID=UPI0018795412|nr:type 2 lanthipeptide synthetase LanM family protein [Bacillus halotolerans]MEC1543694.1 type 2 lanthipeptide synthetase LanM family protein [Bacillus halotolerans]
MIEVFKRSAYLNEREPTRKSRTFDHLEGMKEWTKAIPHEMFEKRLEKDHLTIEQLMLHIEQKDSPFMKKKLQWIETFEELMDTYETSPLDYLSFQSLIDPFIIYAKKQLERLYKKVDSNLINFETVTQSIADALYGRLHTMLMKCVILEINIARTIGVLEGETSKERFQYFMRQFNENHETRIEFFSNYPVLSRLMTESTQNYLNITEELIERFLYDYRKIEGEFEGNFTRLERLRMDLGDTHQNGRTVAILEFESGDKLVYKPRQILIYKCFESLLGWLNDRGLQHKLKAARSLDCETYGWQEFVPSKECILEEEVRRFYYRQGVYTALFYILGSSDFHAENIIAQSEYPVPIDLETLFSQNLEMTKNLKVQSQLAIELNDSVYSTLMLPLPSLEHSIIDFDLSALGARKNQMSEKIKSIRIEGEGTDEIRVTRGPAKSGEYNNRPILEGETMSPSDYITDLEQGFTDMYRLFLNHREEFISEDGPLQPFGKAHVRQVFRPTHVYSEFLQNSLHPDYVQNGLDRVQLFDILWQVSNQTSKFEELVMYETKDLLRHDIPYFYFELNSRDLYDSDGNHIPAFFTETGLETVYKKVSKLNEIDLEKQKQYVRWSLVSMLGEVWEFPEKVMTLQETDEEPKGTFTEEALEIGRLLMERAILEDNMEANWLGLNLNDKAGLSVSVKGPDLYDGLIGYALFFAYLAKETNNEEYEKMSRGAIRTVVRKAGDKPLNDSISAFSGEGSLIYGLVHLGLLWNDQELIKQAKGRLRYVYEIVKKEKNLDFSGGLAGFIILCLNIFNEIRDDDYLNVALQAGDQLMIMLVENNITTGLAHGAAGYAWALGLLGELSQEEKYKAEAQKLLVYENTFYNDCTGNWDKNADEKKGERNRVYWCHGAPGIALSRIMLKDIINSRTIKEDIDIALRKLITEGGIESHCLCHGTIGNADILLTAAEELNEGNFRIQALELTKTALTQKKVHGWVYGLDPRAEMDGFMLGSTGIGYCLLRMKSKKMPSVLALQLPKGEIL